MIHINDIIADRSFFTSLFVDSKYPEMYSASSVRDFAENKDNVATTGISFFSPRKHYRGSAFILFENPVKFNFLGKLWGTGKRPEGPAMLGNLEDITAEFPVFVNLAYFLEREQLKQLEKSPRLYSAQVVFNPADKMTILIDYELHDDGVRLDLDKKRASLPQLLRAFASS